MNEEENNNIRKEQDNMAEGMKQMQDEQIAEYNRPNNLIEDANDAAERMEAANARMEDLIKRQEFLATQDKLGGRSEAGIQAPKKEKISDKEYAKQIIEGNYESETTE
jgi:hypothetical protein